jgi:hypothetical protein
VGKTTRRRERRKRETGRRSFLPDLAAESLCALLALIALHPLLTSGHLWGHDTRAHLFRIAEVARALGEGVLYPRFIPDAYGGLGGPILNFNPVAPYYLPALLVLAGLGPIAALKISAGALMLAGGIAVRLLARPHLGRLGAAVAGLAYVFLPYRIANLYVRMAYSELAAMVMIPLAMAAARRAAIRPTARRLAVCGVMMGCLLAVHFPGAVIGVPLVLFYALASVERGGHRRAGLSFAASFALALMIGAFAWLPALVEIGETHYEESTAGYDSFRHHFVNPAQLLSTRWGFGSYMPGATDRMSFQVGWAHLLCFALAVLAAWRFRHARPLVATSAAIIVGSAFMMLPYSRWLWDRLSIIQNLQFPWRLLLPIGISTSLCAGLVSVLPGFPPAGPGRGKRWKGGGDPRTGGEVESEGERRGARRVAPHLDRNPPRSSPVRAARAIVPALVAVLLVGACLPYLQARRGEGRDADFTPEAIRGRYLGEIRFQPREVATPRYRPEGPRAALLDGGTARIVEDRTHRMSIELNSPSRTTLRLHLFNTPGWRARVDGESEAAIRTEPETGLVLVEVPRGRHRIDLRFSNTPLRLTAWLITLAGLLAASAALFAPFRALRPAA